MARSTECSHGALHGVLTWGLATLVTFYLLSTTLGGLIGGMAGVVGRGVSLAAAGVVAAAPAAAKAVGGQIEPDAVSFDAGSLRRQLETVLRQTNKPELQPSAIAAQANSAGQDARATAVQAANVPQASDDEVKGLVDRLTSGASTTIEAADRDALVNVVMARTGKSRGEATQVVANYETAYRQAQEKYKEAKVQAGQKAREVGDKVATGVSKASLWTFLALVVSAIAAALGGRLGTPRSDRLSSVRMATV